jgi:Fic family protein
MTSSNLQKIPTKPDITIIDQVLDLQGINLQYLSEANFYLGKLSGLLGYFYKPEMVATPLLLAEIVASCRLDGSEISLMDQLQLEMINKKPQVKNQREVIDYKNAILNGLEYIKTNRKCDLNLLKKIYHSLEHNSQELSPEIEKQLEQILGLGGRKDFSLDIANAIVLQTQIEIIKPFPNHNEKIARIMFILHLISTGCLVYPALYFSSYRLQTKSKYNSYLQEAADHGVWTGLIDYSLLGIAQKAEYSVNALYEILNQKDDYKFRLKKYIPKIYSPQLVDFLFLNPFCNKKTICDKLQITRNTATKYFKLLVKFGFLSLHAESKEKTYVNRGFLAILS